MLSLNANAWFRSFLAAALVTGIAACGAEDLAGTDGYDETGSDSDDSADVAELDSALTSCAYPAQILDMARWKLQLPFGTPIKEVSSSSLTAYSHTPDFRTSTDCTWVRFRAP